MNTMNSEQNPAVTLDDFCRLCLRQCGAQWMRPWRERTTELGTEIVPIPEMLVYCCGLPSNLTGELPQYVCRPCATRLEQAYSICRNFKENETVLNRFYSNGSVLDRLVQYEKFRFGEEDKAPLESAVDESEQSQNFTSHSPNEDIDVSETTPADENLTIDESQPWKQEPDINQAVFPVLCIPDCVIDDISTSKSYVSPHNESDSSDKHTKAEPVRSKKNNKRKKHAVQRQSVPMEPPEDGFFRCTECPRRFPQRRHFLEHLAKHRARMEQRYKCLECDINFGKKDHLVRHTLRHQKYQ